MRVDRLHRVPIAVAAGVVLACAGVGRAQNVEYRLDESGRWVAAPATGAVDEDAAVIAQARRDIAEERFKTAKDALDEWIKVHERRGHPLLPQAYLLRGDALTALGEEFQALYDYEAVCIQYSASPEYVKAVERELEIGRRYVNGYKRRFLWIRFLGAEDMGQELLIRVQERMPRSRVAERAGIELADYYFRIQDMAMAAEAYKLFLENYPRSEYAQKAMQRRAYAAISRYKGPRYDSTPLIDAKILVKRFASEYPAAAQSAGLDEALIARLDESAAASLLESADWYMRRDDPVSARYALDRLIQRHPRTAAATTAMRIQSEHGWLPFARPAPEPVEPGAEEPGATPVRPRFVPGRPLTLPPHLRQQPQPGTLNTERLPAPIDNMPQEPTPTEAPATAPPKPKP